MFSIIVQYLYRLVPGNPILLRVIETGGRRRRDLFIRCAYLGALVLLVLMMLVQSTSLDSASLAALTRRSGEIFWWMSHVQLALVALLAPIFTAGAITQEKDSQTYDILLSTPLTNGQIVLGSLLSRVFFVVALLISGMPIFAITQVFGGVAIRSIVQAFLIAAVTALLTGSMAMAIAVFKVGTRRTIFTFYLCILLALAIPLVLEQFGFARIEGARPGTHSSLLAGVNPFLAMRVIFNDGKYLPPEMGQTSIAGHSALVQWYFARPEWFFITSMTLMSVILILPSILLLRLLAQSTNTMRGWILKKLHISSGNRTRRLRYVWANPIAWREARTRASAARAYVMRYGFTTLGVGAAIVLLVLHAQRQPPDVVIADAGYDAAKSELTILDHSEIRKIRLSFFAADQTSIQMDETNIPTTALTPGMILEVNEKPGQPGRARSIKILHPTARVSLAQTRQFLLGAVWIEVAMILLVVTQSAASTVTREKEDGSLDLIISTPITSRYYIWGKLRGLVSFALPLLAVPLASLLLFLVYDLFRFQTDPPAVFTWTVFPYALIALPPMLIVMCAIAAILGMKMSLQCRTTVMAVIASVGIMAALAGGLGFCGMKSAGSNLEGGGLVVSALSPFSLAGILIDGANYAPSMFGGVHSDFGAAFSNHLLVLIAAWAMAGVYAVVVYTMYTSMVKNFDMTIRAQAT